MPHVPKDKPQNASLAANYCLPINDQQPWCYSNSSTVRWEYCPPPICAEDDIYVRQEDNGDDQLQQILDAEKMCGTSTCSAPARIINGAKTQPCVHPWMAQVAYSKE